MDLSIIIPSYNTADLLDRCLDSVFRGVKDAAFSWEIIVVDNASKDGTIELLNKKYTRVHTVLNKENIGYGKANNIGIRMAIGKYILLLNSDIIVENRAIETLFSFIKRHPDCFVGGRLLNEDKSTQTSAGPFPTLPVVFLSLFVRGDRLGLTRYSPDRVSSVDWLSGACLGGAKKDFLDVGLFDEEIFMYMEEVEFLYRASQKGYRAVFSPEAVFVHTGAASSGSRREPVVNIYRGFVYFYRKHRSIMEQRLLGVLLKLKAVSAIVIGRLSGSSYLVSTYEKALSICR